MQNNIKQDQHADFELIQRFDMAGKLCGQLAITLGVAVLSGWLGGIVTLTNIIPEWVAMQPNTALCLVLLGVCLLAARKSHSIPSWRVVHFGSAMIVFGIGLATLFQYWFNVHLGIDQLFMAGDAGHLEPTWPGRMAFSTATNFCLTGAALALLDTRARMLSQPLTFLALACAALALLGYLYDLNALQEVPFFSTMALHTAVGSLLVGMGILLIRPTEGIGAILVSTTVGGHLARRMLPLVVATPFLLGWLRIEGERRDLYASSFGVALTAIAYVILFSLYTWRTANKLRRTDGLRLDAEQVKRVQGAQMSGLIESAMDAIVMLDQNQCIIVFNPAAEKMFGYSRADILGSPLSKLLPESARAAHGEQMRAFGATRAASRRMGKSGFIPAMRADGSQFPTETSISHFDAGQGLCYTAIVRDITERVRVEQELHASEQRERERSQELSNLLFAVPAAVCIAHDSLLGRLTGNALYDRWFDGVGVGTNHPEPSSSEPVVVHAALSPGERSMPWEAPLRQAAAGVEVRGCEFKHMYEDGSARYLLGNAIPLWNEQGMVAGAISAFVDVTELKLSELAMLSVTAGSVAKSDYITHMTHELRTPLGTMLGYAQMLETSTPALSPVQLASIRQILKAGWYLRDLIAEVQELAMIEAESAGLLCEPVAVDALLHEACDMIAPQASHAGLRVSLLGRAGLGIAANPVRIKQIMLNLLSNAVKYNRPGGNIAVTRAMDGQSRVRIGVRDTGHGLTANEVASLFQPFNRLGQERGNQVGTGVGLVVTKKLVESMGGTIGVESDVGGGSLFWFSMPVGVEATPPLAIA